ncbi:ATP-binding protein, partial [Patescibacteria group bacterium]|nr:ATP-binding protein [Patescibacteria group bacterium]
NASGMTKLELLKAIKFGSETSGFQEGKKVRGFLGRGLKESIIALGKGTVITKKSGEISGVKIWIEKEGGEMKVFYKELENESFLKAQAMTQMIEGNHGTLISITDIYEDFKIPTGVTLFNQIKNHYQLRDINSNPNRNVELEFYESGTEYKSILLTQAIKYEYPSGKIKLEKEIIVDNKTSYLKIYESEEQLDSPLHNALGEAGILIKTEGSILENSLFKFVGNEAGLYFFGSLDDPEIANKLRKGEMLISANRNGLDWKDSYLIKLKEEIEEALKIVISDKEMELRDSSPQELTEKNKALVNKLKNLLNSWAKAEDMSWESPIDPSTLDTMILKPESLEVEKDIPRVISIYLPKEILDVYGESKIKIESDNPLIEVSADNLSFKQHKDYPELSIGKFFVTGKKIDEEGIVGCYLGDYSAFSIVSVVEKIENKDKTKKKKLNPRSGGFLRDIKSDARENPTQRVSYDTDLGEIRIYVNFPGVKDYLKSGLAGSETPEGTIMIAELVTEVFCRTLSLKGLNTGKYLILGTDKDSVISAYNKAFYDLMNEYSEKIHRAVTSHFRS